MSANSVEKAFATLAPEKKYKRDLKRIRKQGKDERLLEAVIDEIAAGESLEAKREDHPLNGKYSGCRGCHIEPDWVLIYRLLKRGKVPLLRLVRTGSHGELFGM